MTYILFSFPVGAVAVVRLHVERFTDCTRQQIFYKSDVHATLSNQIKIHICGFADPCSTMIFRPSTHTPTCKFGN